MRPASSRVVTLWITVLCLLAALFSLDGLASAQAAAGSKRKLSQQSLHQSPAAGSFALARAAKRNAPPPATTDTWNGGGGANTNWSDASNWNNGAITSGENIVISTASAASVVDSTFTIGTLTLGGTGDSATISNGNDLIVDGNISNAGTITLGSTTTYTYLQIGANLTLSGAGTLVLGSATPYNYLQATASGNILTNQSTIEGAGTIGNGSGLVLSNSGTINANVSGQNLLMNGGASTNTGTLEATGGGTLVLQGASWTNTSGNITAANNSAVVLDSGVTVTGGTLNGSGTGIVYGAGATLVGLTTEGNFQVQNNNTTTISGTINNTGTITLASTTTYTYLDVASGGATLSGGGTVVMGAGAQFSYIDGPSGASFTNSNNTIEGIGQIGNSHLTLVNNGTINANVSPTVLNSPLELYSGSGGITNTSTLEATNGGDLYIYGSNLTNSGSGAVIKAVGADGSGNASYVLLNADTINRGTLTTSGVGVIYGEGGTTLVGLTNSGSFWVLNGQATNLSGTITNTGTMTVGSTTTWAYLDTAANTTLTGGGTVVMGAGAQFSVMGGVSGTTLTNSNNTIEGDGFLGDGQITFVNHGTVNANTSGQTLELQPIAGTNTATLEATNGGTLLLNASNWTNTGGTITAATGSAVNLQGVTLTGGTLTTSGTGVVNGWGSTTLVGLTNAGSFYVPNGNVANLSGTITNTGTMTLGSTTTWTYLDTAANTTLTGGGTVVMGAGAQYSVMGGVSGTTLTNSNNTIEGSGYIGNGQITFVNHGTVIANTSGQTLDLQPVAGTNTATMEATNGGTLELYSSSWTNTGGTITAAPGSAVVLYGTKVTGGTLSGTGIVYGENSSTLVGLTNAGSFYVPNGYVAYLSGTINNTGTMTIGSTSTYTDLNLAANTTLSGNGTVVLGAGAQYSRMDGASGLTFTNSGNTIEGDGYIGLGDLVVTNKTGSMIANVSGQTLTIQSAGAGFTNDGTVEGTNSASLIVQGTLTNYASGTNTLSGGAYIANGGNVYLPLGSSGGIATLSASVTEENGGLILNSNNANNNALNGLTSITSTGALTIGGVAFTDAGAFSNAGSLTILTGESFTVGSLTQISGNTLTAGTYVLDANLNLSGAAQNITTNAANVTLAGGTIHNNTGGTNALANLATNTGKLTLANNANFTTVGNFSNTGTLTINSGSAFTLGGSGTLAQITGSTISGGTFVLGGNLNVGTGINITTNSSTLTLEGGTIMSGATNALLNLATNTESLTLANNANFTTTGNFTNNGSLTVNSGSTFTVLHTKSLTNYHNGTNTLQGGTYVVGGTLAFDAGTTGAIKTDSANITLEGSGQFFNTSTGAPSTNALLNLATISSTGSFTLSQSANFTAAGNFTNNNKLTVNSGSTFTLTGSNLLTNLASGTLTGGTYTVGGTLQLTSANGGITTNAANLTLTGTSAKILDGASNALAGFNNNTGTFTLSGGASLTAASSNFTNTGTVTVSKGTTLTVPGTGHTYSQTAGQTTIDGTLAGINGGASVTGGTILGAGTVKGNLTVGTASVGSATINVGDNAKAGLLSITGTYTQLATGTMTGLINGTTAGSGFSQLKVTGTAALAGTINFTVASAFQSSLTLGETFTVLTASSVSGTFSNSTIAINATFHFTVTYTSTGVVLTVASGPASAPNASSAAQPVAQIATASAKPAAATAKSKTPVLVSGLRRVSGASKTSKPVLVAGLAQPAGHSNAILARGSELNGLRSWERIPVVSVSQARPVVVAQLPHAVNASSSRANLPTSDLRMGRSHAIGVPSHLAGWMGTSGNRRVPVKILPSMLPRITR